MSRECSCVPGHRMIEPQGICGDCGLTEMEAFELGRDNIPPCRKRRGDRLWLLGFLIGPLFAWLCWCVSRRRWVQASFAVLVNAAFWIGGGFVLGELGVMVAAARGA